LWSHNNLTVGRENYVNRGSTLVLVALAWGNKKCPQHFSQKSIRKGHMIELGVVAVTYTPKTNFKKKFGFKINL
jgi:hypothetical protein